MATSENQSDPAMRRISPKNPVVRCLFPADKNEAISDNFFNDLQESFDREIKEMTEKYNFDFRNDEPLKGKFIWEKKKQPEGWVGYDFGSTDVDEPIEEISSTVHCPLQDQLKNETTPRAKNENSTPKLNRKRKSNVSNRTVQKLVKRRMDFVDDCDI